jgi:hypothetical protein
LIPELNSENTLVAVPIMILRETGEVIRIGSTREEIFKAIREVAPSGTPLKIATEADESRGVSCPLERAMREAMHDAVSGNDTILP